MASIKDVAKRAGVSVSTVSNILNQKTSVSAELHQKVVDAMKELDYHPNFLAMNLKRNRINFIGVIVSSLTGHYHQLYDGIDQVSREIKCQPILKIAKTVTEEFQAIEELLQLNVSGIIVVSSNLNDSLVKYYASLVIPVVFADFYPINTDLNTVRFDNYHVVQNIMESLMSSGKRVGLITGNHYLGSESDCINAYLNGLRPSVQQEPIMFETVFNKEIAFADLFDFIFHLEHIPECFIVSNANLAKSISEICSLIGANDICIYALSGDSWYVHRSDSVSYLRRRSILCGIQAAELLFENIKNPATFDTKQITIELHEEQYEEFTQNTIFHSCDQKIKLLLLKSSISSAIEKLSKNFTACTGIEVSVTTANQQDLVRLILENVRNKSSEYDIIMADMHWLQQLRQENVFLKLNNLLPIESIMPRYVREVRNYILSEANGEDIYALPILVGHQMLAYRSDLFDDPLLKKQMYLRYGVELQPPRTWNEFNLIAKFFTKALNVDSPVNYGTCLVGSRPEGIMAEFLPRQWSYGGKFFNLGKLDLISIANQKAAKCLCESYQYSYPNCMNFMEDEQIQEFANGNVAMISTYSIHLQDHLNFPNGNVQFSKLPGSQALIGGWMLGISAHSQKIDACVEFLKWELSNKISIHSSLLGQVSPFKNVLFDRELLTIYPWMNAANQKSVSLHGKEFGTLDFHNNHQGRQLECALAEGLWDAILGKVAADEMLYNVQETFRNYLNL